MVGSPPNTALPRDSLGDSNAPFMAKNPTLRSFLVSMVLLSLVSTTTSCRSWQTVLIPRYKSGSDQVKDPFGGEVFRHEQTSNGRHHALLAVCRGDKLLLAAQVGAGFAGQVTWSVGDCQLAFDLESKPSGSGIPIQVTGDLNTNQALVGQATTTEDMVTVTVSVPRRALAKGDGTLGLKFVARDGSASVVLPASGRLRGIYMMQ